jgi:thiamine kinase-like enzyme
VIWPDELKGFLERVEKIRAVRSRASAETYCHNDYFTFNMIYDGQNLKVIDWELSGYGDCFFDLATLSYSNHFSVEEEKFLLGSYFGFFEEEQLATLHDMKFVCMVREAAWGMLYSGLKLNAVNQPMDYYGFVLYVMKRLRQGYVTL